VADTKISALPAASAAAVANELAINEAGASKKLTLTQVETLLQARGMPRVRRLASQHALASTTATAVTGLSMTLEAGTYTFKYYLIVQSSATATGLKFGINFTGTQDSFNVLSYYLGTGTAASTGIIQGDTVGIAETLVEGFASRTLSTSAADIGPHTGVGTANVDNLNMLEGLINVTVAGDIELWHGSETATTTSVEVGSSLVVIRTA
jgi:hypothetical protein